MYEDIISKAYKNIKPGTVYRVHKNNDIEPHIKGHKYKKIFKDLRMLTLSTKGNVYIAKIAICGECGDRMIGNNLVGGLCRKCKAYKKKITKRKAYHANKNKPKKKTAREIAYEITGDYPRVNREYEFEEVRNELIDQLEDIEFNKYLQQRKEAA